MVFITFIIPTLGRDTLYNSLLSLVEQNNNDWNALVIFDGIKQNIEFNDSRIKYIEIDKIGENNGKGMSGYVRNIGFNILDATKTEWIGFLDDDDILDNKYITKLKEEIDINKDIEVCIFRMCYKNGYVLPPIYEKTIKKGHFGISFAIKSHICKNIQFKNNVFEDYFYLKELQEKKYKMLISSSITYYVKEKYKNQMLNFPKVLIN